MARKGRQVTKGPDPKTKARWPEALDLRIAGATYRQIAAQMGINLQVAYAAVQGALGELDALTKEKAERHRDLELRRLERATLGLWTKVQAGDERAILAWVRCADRKAKLLGLDAPTEIAGPGGVPLTFTLTLDRPGGMRENPSKNGTLAPRGHNADD